MKLPKEPYCLDGGGTRRIFEIIINATTPDYATVSSHECRRKLQQKNEFVFGWTGYLKGVSTPPASAHVESYAFGEGVILAAKVEQFNSANEGHIAAVRELNEIMQKLGWSAPMVLRIGGRNHSGYKRALPDAG